MLNGLDLLIVAVMVLAAASLLSMALMFLVKSQRIRTVCLWIVALLGIYMGYVGIRINWPGFVSQVILAAVLALISVVSLVLNRKGSGQKFQVARILASVSLVAGMLNAFS